MADLSFGSLCSGIEAASVAFGPIGWRAAWFSEIDRFACALLAHRYPDVPNLGDMKTVARRVLAGEVEAPDVLCGGTPCQAFSVAGLRESLSDERGNLSLKFCEIANAVDHVRSRVDAPPSIIFWENVPGVLSTRDNAFGCFLAGLAGEDGQLVPPGKKWGNAGAVYGPKRAIAWRTLDAQYCGLAQRRRRVFVVASARKGFDPAQVLFEWNGVRRDSPPSRKAGAEIAGTIAASAGKRCGVSESDRGSLVAYGGNRTSGPIDVAPGLPQGGAGWKGDFESEAFIVAHTLRASGFDASEDGTGRGTPLVAVDIRTGTLGGITHTLQAGLGTDRGGNPNAIPHLLAFDTTQITSAENRSNPQPGDPCQPLSARAHAPAIAFHGSQDPDVSGDITHPVGRNNGLETCVAFSAKDHGADACEDLAPTLRAGGHASSHANAGVMPAVMQLMRVRRLTPRECERLQGFPDDYTLIPWRTWQESARRGASYEGLLKERGMTLRGPSIEECPDGPRYKALGNSWPVPVVRWIGQRVDAAVRALL